MVDSYNDRPVYKQDMGENYIYYRYIITMIRITYIIRVGWWISKVGDIGVKWKLLGIETAVVKGFFKEMQTDLNTYGKKIDGAQFFIQLQKEDND